MVLIGGVKYACERCIRGHRVTTCNHTDQPLIMIKPKGRPSSQCKHCKNLRVNKNLHTSSSCTCGEQVANGIKKKKCGCESSKPCDCHRKKPQLTTTKKNSTSPVDIDVRKTSLSRSVSSSSAVSVSLNSLNNKESGYSSKRAGEVVVPITEYVPHDPQHEIGPVYNEKAINGIFQDVPLPFEPGHGLLDLFESSNTTPSTSITPSNHPSTTDHYRPRHPNNYYYSSYSSSNDTPGSTKSSINFNNHNELKHTSYNNKDVSSNINIKSINTSNLDLFHNLGLSPTTEPQSMTPTGHPMPLQRHQSADTLSHTNSTSNHHPHQHHQHANNHHHHQQQQQQHNQTSGTLFGNYSNYNKVNQSGLDRDSLTSRSEVEVCSVTPSFNDIKNSDYIQSDSHLSHVTNGFDQNGESSVGVASSGSPDGSGVNHNSINGTDSTKSNNYKNNNLDDFSDDKFNINMGFLDTSELVKLKDTDFPEMLKF